MGDFINIYYLQLMKVANAIKTGLISKIGDVLNM